MRQLIFLLLMGTAPPDFAYGASSPREQVYAEQIRQTVSTGRAVNLQTPTNEFLGIYTETVRPAALGAAIVLHDRGGNPDLQNVIHRLRTQLPRHRWTTLSVQMPVRESDAPEADYFALFADAKTRIDAAVDFLQQAQYQNIAVVGYGLGALMGLYSLSESSEAINAFVAISLPVPDSSDPNAQTLDFLDSFALPMLDIYAEFDMPQVVNTTRSRQLKSRSNPSYRQDRIGTAGHDYRHNEDILIKRVYSWLSRVAQNNKP